MINYDFLEKQIDWKNLLIGNYKKLGISEDEVITLLVIQYCLDNKEKTITPELVSIKTNFDVKKSSLILTNLLNKGLIILDSDESNSFSMSLKGIKRILIDDFVKDNNTEENINSNLFSLFENAFGRTLSFAEIEIIKGWIDDNTKEDIIRYALKEAISKNIKNIRYVEKIIINTKASEERKKEGWTTIGESNNIIDSLNNIENDK